MEAKKINDELIQKVLEGLTLAVKKVYEEAGKNNQPLAVNKNGKVELVYPKAA